MGPTREDSPRARTASNGTPLRPWLILADACRETGRAARDPKTVQSLLQGALDATGTERAFVVRGAGADPSNGPTVTSVRMRAGRPTESPSRTVLLRVLAARRSFACPDVRVDPVLAAGRSVRSLRLRCVLSAPVPCDDAFTTLVLDGRDVPLVSQPQAERLVSSFAALVGLVIRATAVGSCIGFEAAPRATTRAEIVGRSAAVRKLRGWVGRVAPGELPVLIKGETGSGKELVARMLHEASGRHGGPFVAVNCAAFTDTLLDAELFGAERGAYTGADRQRPGLFRLARGGTLFLDEVAEMSPSMQAKLLRVLQESRVRPVGGEEDVPVDVRVLAATHHDMTRLLEGGAFRADLFYRLAVVEVRVPALRDRLDDLEAIVESLKPRLFRETGAPTVSLSGDAWRALRAHEWPGNVRELHAVVARALLRSGGALVETRHLDPVSRDLDAPAPAGTQHPWSERQMIVTALRKASGSVTRAAREIGWSRQKLYRRMRTLAVPRWRS